MSSEPGSARTLAGLIDVLDRADDGLSVQRPRRRTSAHRPGGSRSGVRTPLRSVQPAPMARRTPGAPVPPARTAVVAVAPQTGIRLLSHRIAMWGAGPDGEYLAWRAHRPRAVAAQARPRPSRVQAFVRRVALWGAGPDGEYLAWGHSTRTPATVRPSGVVDGPVVLRELPSTPTIQPAAPSPAAAQPPRGPASSAGTRGMPPVPRGAVAVPGVRPGGPPERSRATGWPSPASRSLSPTGLVRTRGDPLDSPARGSPP
jgi:hypothetical protein